MLLLLACTPAAGAKGGATRFPSPSWRHADAAARMWAESGDHRFSFSELGDSPQGAWTAAATREKRKHPGACIPRVVRVMDISTQDQ